MSAIVCTACPDRRADPSQHCEGCGQHLTRGMGVLCLTECADHPSGEHRPGRSA